MVSAIIIVFMIILYMALRDVLSMGQMMLVFVPLLMLVQFVRDMEGRARQTKRNKVAQELVGKGHPTPITDEYGIAGDPDRILFLRPFALDLKLTVTNPRLNTVAAWIVPFHRMTMEGAVPVDEALRLAVQHRGELTALGSDSGIGAARVTTPNEYWTDHVANLAQRAVAIVLFVGSTPGTVFEIEMVAKDQRLLRKTLFVVPPQLGFGPNPDPMQLASVQQVLKDAGLKPSADLDYGDGVAFDAAGMCRFKRKIINSGALQRDDVVASLESLLPLQTAA